MKAEFDIPIRRPSRQEVDEASVPLDEHGLECDGGHAAVVLVGDPVKSRLPECLESRTRMGAELNRPSAFLPPLVSALRRSRAASRLDVWAITTREDKKPRRTKKPQPLTDQRTEVEERC